MQFYSCLGSCHQGLQRQVCGLQPDAARFPTAAANFAQRCFTAACSLTGNITGIVHVAVQLVSPVTLHHFCCMLHCTACESGPSSVQSSRVVHISLDAAPAYCCQATPCQRMQNLSTATSPAPCKPKVTICHPQCLCEVSIPLEQPCSSTTSPQIMQILQARQPF